jgi:hypothetical protein
VDPHVKTEDVDESSEVEKDRDKASGTADK